MRILFVNALFEPFKGGVEKHTLELGKALVKRGVEVHVLTGRLHGTRTQETIRGVKVHRIECTEVRVPALYPPPVIIAPKAYEELKKLDAKHRFDVIHLQDRWFPDFNMSALYAKAVGKPLVITLHNARPLGIAPQYTVVGGLYDLAIGRQVLALADKIISVSKWAIEDICKYGLKREKFVHIPNGIDSRELKPSSNGGAKKFRAKYDVGGKPMVLYVGRIIKQKGLEYLLHSWKQVEKSRPQAKLVIVGRGNELHELQKLSRKLGVEKSVLFTGYVSEHELYEALHACDVFVLPSLWEVLPMAILEAMAAGKSVVCTDAGGNEELVRNGVNGFVVPKKNSAALAHALELLLADEKLRRRMGAAGRKRACKEFDWRIIAARTYAFYKRLLRDFMRKRAEEEKPGIEKLIELSEEVRTNLRNHRAQAKEILRDYGREWEKRVRNAQEALMEVI